MTNETRQRLLDVLLSCRAIGRYTAGLDFTGYEDSEWDIVKNKLPRHDAQVEGILRAHSSRLSVWCERNRCR
jgi:hypothetical protein